MEQKEEVWVFIANQIRAENGVILLQVVESMGSSPGRVGFRMAVVLGKKDGKNEAITLLGSIGGGIMEQKLVALAVTRLREGRGEAFFKRQVHRKDAPNEQSGMICSGEQTVFFYPFKMADLAVVEKISGFLIQNKQNNEHSVGNTEGVLFLSEQGIRFVLEGQDLRNLTTVEVSDLTTFDVSDLTTVGASNLTTFDVSDLTTVGASHLTTVDVSDLTTVQKLSNLNFEFENGVTYWKRGIYIEKLNVKNHLYILGGGHCALALSRQMRLLTDFRIHLFDDRTDLNTFLENDAAHEKTVIDYAKIADIIPEGSMVYVVLMTVGYRSDAEILRGLFSKKLKYLGMLGSRSKVETLLKDLENEGFGADFLAKIHAPIGLDIKSRTPEEIAVSIAAEIIKVKNSRNKNY